MTSTLSDFHLLCTLGLILGVIAEAYPGPPLLKKMKFSIKESFSKLDQIRSFLRIWSHLLKKFLIENFIFCAVSCKYLK